MVPFRHVNGFTPVALFDEQVFGTTGTEEKAYWSHLRSYSEVPSRGMELFKIYDEDRRAEMWELFRSFVRQASNYWEAARQLNYRSSPLIYYYCFLNLVKAYLLIHNRDMPAKMAHGMSVLPIDASTGIDCISVKIADNAKGKSPSKVFALLYTTEFSKPVEEKTLSLKCALSYVYDIGLEFRSRFPELRHCAPFIHRVVADNSHMWSICAFPKQINIQKHTTVFEKFFQRFDSVDIKSIGFRYWELFGGSPSTENSPDHMECFQTKEEFKNELFQGQFIPVGEKLLFRDCLQPYIQPTYQRDDYSGMLFLPPSIESIYPTNELISIYAGMFMLSSLVRYNPMVLDRLLETKDGLLIDTFLDVCPTKFLRVISSKIFGAPVLFSPM